MIMKKILLVTMGENTGKALSGQLDALYGSTLQVTCRRLEDLPIDERGFDLVVFSSNYVRDRAIRSFSLNSRNIVAHRVVNHKNIRDLISLERGMEVLFVNDGFESATEAIEQLQDLGLDHIKYYPYYPGIQKYPRVSTIVTPGESQLCPYGASDTIDIGSRILGLSTIFEINNILFGNQISNHAIAESYLKDIVEISKSIDKAGKETGEIKDILEKITNSLDFGLAFIDNQGIIRSINSRFEKMLQIKRMDLLNKKTTDIEGVNKILKSGKDTYRTRVGSRNINLEMKEVTYQNRVGHLIKSFYDTMDSSRAALYESNRNLHDFDDYYSVEPEVLGMLKKAIKYATTEGTILIHGENGTGKEILAQAIHKNSNRKNNAFVPINIAAISSNLVESELFGYEEGAFTGALKGGREGLFKIADGGTLFIDEIGDTPLDIQAKLLRALEEKRIRKVGGGGEELVDVRIIAATNRNLIQMVKEGTFRQDLFFRLNILPLQTIPLRNRPADIEMLLKMFLNSYMKTRRVDSLNEIFTTETLAILRRYRWIGNVRELKNLTEYLSHIYTGDKICKEDLHSYILEDAREEIKSEPVEDWILRMLDSYSQVPVGRKRLLTLAVDAGYDLGEGQLRSILDRLKDQGLVETVRNKGMILSDKGRQTK
jgi:transcriptional regulator with PAS, ATPase and Fis domain/HPt (histidine-containing phosphotransfer) domain-containing protein